MQPSSQPFLLDYVLFLPGIWFVSSLGAGMRVMGPLFVLIPAFSLFYAMLRLVVPPRFDATACRATPVADGVRLILYLRCYSI